MKRFFFALVVVQLFSSSFLQAAEMYKLYGKFIKLEKSDSRNIYNYDYYFYLSTDQGKDLAYPVIVEDPGLVKMIEEKKGKDFSIEAEVEKKEIPYGEATRVVEILRLKKVQPFSLQDLSYHPKKNSKSVLPDPNKAPNPDKPTLKGLNDSATNAAIFTMGAALLGSILLSK